MFGLACRDIDLQFCIFSLLPSFQLCITVGNSGLKGISIQPPSLSDISILSTSLKQRDFLFFKLKFGILLGV